MRKKFREEGLSAGTGLIAAGGFLLLLILGTAGPAEFAFGQSSYPPNWSPVIYPKQNQTAEQQEKDKFECYNFAKQNSGFDPMAPVQATAPPAAEAPAGGAVRGAARGAAVGAVGGAIAGDAGKGAAIGAATGGVIGGVRRRDQAQREQVAQEQYVSQQQANYNQKRDGYNRAYGACLEGRGYTVK